MVNLQVVIMAAGLGSRYGGLKQIDEFGPSREFLMDYAIYDSYQLGIRRICVVVRESFLAEIKDLLASKWQAYEDLQFDFICQETADLPSEFRGQEQREKPWGTAHILYVLRDQIKTPFIIMNADDFYGRSAMKMIAKFLIENPEKQSLVSYALQKTLSPFGPVTRGICEIKDGKLVAIDEVSGILPTDPRQGFASMNLWGFSPSLFALVEDSFKTFLKKNIKETKTEYQIPQMINDFLKEKKIEIVALPIDSEWFGVTHKDDKEPVQQKINALIENGTYPQSLFAKPEGN
jgi:dTDP-glucose pyrophosphorylase